MQKKASYAFFLAIEKLCAVLKHIFSEKLLNLAQVASMKMPRNEAKIYKQMDFLPGTEGYLLTSSSCFLTTVYLAINAEVLLVR